MNQQDQCTDCVKPILCSECEVFMEGNPGIVSLPPIETWKECRKCGGTFPLSYFHRKSAAKDGRQATCKMCKAEVDRKRRLKSDDDVKQFFDGFGAHRREVEQVRESLQKEPLSPKSIDALFALLDLMESSERRTLIEKGNDYSGDNRLANFERIGAELGLTPEKVLWIYFKKHTDRLRTFITEGAVSSESVVDSIMDCRNYLALLRLMIEAKA